MNALAGKSIIVTGGASGIGRASATLLAEQGCQITVADLRDEGGEETASLIEKAGGRAQFIRTNVAEEDDVRAMVARAVATYGRLDGAVNAAGLMPGGKLFHELTLADFDRNLAVNLRGTFLCMRHEIIAMLAGGSGSIVNIASMAAVLGVPGSADYCASKAGIMGLVRGAAADYVTKGIRVNAVLPGGTETPMLKASIDQDPNLARVLAASHPMNRLAQPREMASAVRWLISDESSFVTGIGLPVAGGQGEMLMGADN